METLTVNAASEIGRQILAQQERDRLEQRAALADTLKTSIDKIEEIAPRLQVIRKTAEAAVADAERVLVNARLALLHVNNDIAAQLGPFERARDKAENQLRRSASRGLFEFQNELRVLLQRNAIVHEDRRDTTTQKTMVRSNSAAVERHALAIRSAMDAARHLELAPLSDAEVQAQIDKLRSTTAVSTSTFGEWLARLF